MLGGFLISLTLFPKDSMKKKDVRLWPVAQPFVVLLANFNHISEVDAKILLFIIIIL